MLNRLDAIEVIDGVVGARRSDAGASVGTYLVLAALNRLARYTAVATAAAPDTNDTGIGEPLARSGPPRRPAAPFAGARGLRGARPVCEDALICPAPERAAAAARYAARYGARHRSGNPEPGRR